MPTAIEALAKDGSSGGLTGDLRAHELCAFSYDSSDEPTEVIVLIKNEGGDESSKQERAGASKSIEPLLNGSENSSASLVMDNSPPKNMTKRDFGLTDNNNAKLTRQHDLRGAGSKENASPQKETNTGGFAPLGCTKTALFGIGGGSNNPSFCTLMNNVKDTCGETVSYAGIEEAADSRGSHSQAARGNAPKERDGDLFRRELDDVKSALRNHTIALLTLLHETAAKGEKCVPAVLLNPVREETMAALRNANFRFPLSSALSEAENDAVRLYTEEIRQREKERQQQQRLETMNDESSDEEGQCGTKLVLSSANAKQCSNEGCKRPRSDKESENEQVKKRTKYQCSSEGCENNAVKGGVCWRHGAKANAKQCSNEGCENIAVKGGVCWRHGAKKKLCSSEGCTNHAKKGEVCWRHGAKAYAKLCSSEGCTNHAKKGGLCMRHGAQVARKLCSREGCTHKAIQGGVCRKHGAKVKICGREGCTNQAKKGGLCKRHGRNDLA